MNDIDVRQYFQERIDKLLTHYASSRSKYEAIWSFYRNRMPQCIANCTIEGKKYSPEQSLDGPQGIYWIGSRPKILFVGREHFGWYGPTQWEADRNSICCSALEFSFFTVSSMGAYWAIIKELTRDVLALDLGKWDAVLENVAFTNACKCLAESGTLQWHLHQQCCKSGYLRYEIETVAAPLNVLFTKSYNLSSTLFAEDTTKLLESDEFCVLRKGKQVLIECAHPGRQSTEWRARLKDIMAQYLDRPETLAGFPVQGDVLSDDPSQHVEHASHGCR